MNSNPSRHASAPDPQPALQRVLQVLRKVYDLVMDKFRAANGQDVLKVVTDSGVTGYMDASVPTEVLEAMLTQVDKDEKQNRKEMRRIFIDEEAAPSLQKPA